MKLIKHMIFVNINEDKKLLINSLKGTMDELNPFAFEALSKWQNCNEIITENKPEEELYNILQARGYLVKNDEEETAMKDKILNILRERHSIDRGACKAMTFVMTYDCNFRCPYCCEGEEYVKKEVMTPELIDAALELVGDSLERICLFGGEPLLPKTRHAIEYLTSKVPDKRYYIITNGYYLEEFADLLATMNLDFISVTIDGDEATHNRKRFLANGKPTYKKIINGIEKCLKKGIYVCIRLNAESRDVKDGVKLQEHLAERFVAYKDLITFEMAPMMGYSNEMKNDLMTEMFCSTLEYDKKERLRRNNQLSTFTPIVSALLVGTPTKPLYSFCYAHENKLAVDPYGNIFTCLVTVGKEHMAAGKYYPTVEFNENSIHNRNIDKISECKECKYSLLCGGGCPLLLPDSSDVFKPVCQPIRNQIHELLPRFYKAEQDHKKKTETVA